MTLWWCDMANIPNINKTNIRPSFVNSVKNMNSKLCDF